jgi:hypothetical protein
MNLNTPLIIMTRLILRPPKYQSDIQAEVKEEIVVKRWLKGPVTLETVVKCWLVGPVTLLTGGGK